ncbi:MAG: hypothetical protein JO112_19725, partial [Planctomycetes bacterium]|nr:hypothetical protein [Planctomycetota bacterium]
ADWEITNAHEKTWAAFPMTRLRPEQVAGAILQAASVTTVDRRSSLFRRAAFYGSENDFVRRYGDTGEDEFDSQAETIPQRLLLMNGAMTKDRTKEDFFNADTRIAWQAPDDHAAVEIAYLAVLSRPPTPEEASHFEARLNGARGHERTDHMEDLYWTLINSSEFSWNH